MFPAPAMPSFPPGQSATTPMYMRYEDLTQDGRLQPLAIPPGLAGLWRDALVHHVGHRNALHEGIIPILTRITIRSLDQTIRLDRQLESRTGFVLAQDQRGDDRRLFMNVWCELHGIAGRIGRPAGTDALVLAGSVFAEHTFTRLLAPPDQRKVTRLGVDGYPDVPELHYPQPSPHTAAEAPDGATWLDELAPDPAEYVFTLDQTDSNQHVNSLVYVRLFLEATNRRLAALGRPLKARSGSAGPRSTAEGRCEGRLRSKAVDVAYRKPCFAGDRVRAYLRLFALGDDLGAAGQIVGDDGKPRCYVRVGLGA